MIATTTISPQLTIPRLENGDKLTRREFERRYKAMPNLKKAGFYQAFTPNLQLGDNCTVRLDADNEPQPDALLRIKNGGQSTISEDGYVEGAPELIVEIAASTVSLDLHQKLNVYRRNQVQEYLVWRVEDGEFDWFRLTNEEYIKLEPNSEGIICSQIFPGLWLDRDALLAGDLAKALEVLQLGIARIKN
jgi:hypothetical protein